jgi:hypothetical protein
MPGRPASRICGTGWGGTQLPQHPGLQHFCNKDAGHHGKCRCTLCGVTMSELRAAVLRCKAAASSPAQTPQGRLGGSQKAGHVPA